MCGIVGVIGSIDKRVEGMFKTLLQVDTERGPHSTGVLGVVFDKSSHITKELGTPWDFYKTTDFNVKLQQKLHKALIGHNRWATKGEITKENAHPFKHGNISGVHNGTLRGQYLLEDFEKFAVDSDNIFYDMSKNGHESTLKNLYGAFALVWYNENSGDLYVIRNEERPLFYSTSEDKKTMAIASEAIFIEYASIKNNVKMGKPERFEIGVLYKINPHTLDIKKTKPALYKHTPIASVQKQAHKSHVKKNHPHNTQLKKVFEVVGEVNGASGEYWYTCGEVVGAPKERVKVYAGGKDQEKLRKLLYNSVSFFSGEISYSVSDGGSKYYVLKPNTVQVEVVDLVVQEEPLILNGVVIEEKEAQRILASGCAWCGFHPPVEEFNDCKFSKTDHNTFLCPDCNADEYISSYLGEL